MEGRINGTELVAGYGVVLLSFMLVGEKGMRAGPLVIRLTEILPWLVMPYWLYVWKTRGFRFSIRPWWILSGILFLAYVGIAVGPGRGLEWGDLRQIKKILLPMVGLFCITTLLVSSRQTARRVLAVVAIGTGYELARMFVLSWPSVWGIRPIRSLYFVQRVGFLYVWGGLASLVLVLGTYVTRERSSRGFWLSLGAYGLGLWGLLFCGTRAVMLAAVTVPVAALVLRHVPDDVVRIGATLLLFVLLIFSLVPQLIPLHYNPFSYHDMERDIDRIIRGDAYETSLSVRVTDWKHMLRERTPRAFLLGPGYQKALEGSVVLKHPHNIIIWAYLLSGIPGAAFLSTAVLFGVLGALRHAAREGDRLSWALAMLMAATAGVLLTNSAVGGVPELVGVLWGTWARLGAMARD